MILSLFNVTVPGSANGSFWEAVEKYHAYLPKLSDSGCSGYYWVAPQSQLADGTPGAGIASILMFPDQNDMNAVENILKPINSSFFSIPGVQTNLISFPSPSVGAAFEKVLQGTSDEDGSLAVMGSRLISRDFLTSDDGPRKLANVLSRLSSQGVFAGHIVAGGQVARNEGKVDSALNPAWRKTLTHIIMTRGWSSSTSVEEQNVIKKNLTEVEVPLLKALEPQMGAYLNEADAREPNFQQSFWGKNYGKLKDIKRKWDPKGLFIVRAGVGSEDWDDSGLCRR